MRILIQDFYSSFILLDYLSLFIIVALIYEIQLR